MNKNRCKWCNLKNPLYIEYHDNEWGVLRLDDAYLYEMLLLEAYQAGLSWECVLNKREGFRRAYDGFDIEKVTLYGEEKIEALLSDSGIIRNRRKVLSSIDNSKIFKEIVAEYGSFASYLKRFWDGNVIYETGCVTSTLSDRISEDLRGRGMHFVGSVIIYSFLQAVGIIYSHDEQCFMYKTKK